MIYFKRSLLAREYERWLELEEVLRNVNITNNIDLVVCLWINQISLLQSLYTGSLQIGEWPTGWLVISGRVKCLLQ